MVWYGMECHGMAWNDIVWYIMVWYDMVWFVSYGIRLCVVRKLSVWKRIAYHCRYQTSMSPVSWLNVENKLSSSALRSEGT